MSDVVIERPEKIQEAYESAVSSLYRWLVLRGGRGSSKSWGIAEIIIILMTQSFERVLCARYQKNKTDASVHQVFQSTIRRLGLTPFFKITNTYIRYIPNGSEINYIGLAVNPDEIKSYEGYTIGWVEEARLVPRKTLFDIFPPTVRGKTEHGRPPILFASYNPELPDDPIHKEIEDGKVPNCKVIDINYWDNPFFPDVLRKDMLHCKAKDYETYRWLWCGELVQYSQEQIFWSKCRISKLPVNPPTDELYFGADWSNGGDDPHTLIRCYIVGNTLYIDRAEFGRCTLEKVDALIWSKVNGSKSYPIKADSSHGDAREGMGSNRYMRNLGYDVLTPKKLSVTAGIRYIRQFDEIVIDYKLKEMIEEARGYKWKKDSRTGEILPVPEDRKNHGWDGIRYALQPLIAKGVINGAY